MLFLAPQSSSTYVIQPAEEYFGITHISDMIYRGKPKWSKCGAWFARITIK